eukprot:4096435-Alexandrium_andersonii.AAC.1
MHSACLPAVGYAGWCSFVGACLSLRSLARVRASAAQCTVAVVLLWRAGVLGPPMCGRCAAPGVGVPG